MFKKIEYDEERQDWVYYYDDWVMDLFKELRERR